MITRFAIGDYVLYKKDHISYTFTITEIKINHAGKFYSGEDEISPVGWFAEKYLELLS